MHTTYITPEGRDAEACCLVGLIDVADVDGATWVCPECGRHWSCEVSALGFDWEADRVRVAAALPRGHLAAALPRGHLADVGRCPKCLGQGWTVAADVKCDACKGSGRRG